MRSVFMRIASKLLNLVEIAFFRCPYSPHLGAILPVPVKNVHGAVLKRSELILRTDLKNWFADPHSQAGRW